MGVQYFNNSPFLFNNPLSDTEYDPESFVEQSIPMIVVGTKQVSGVCGGEIMGGHLMPIETHPTSPTGTVTTSSQAHSHVTYTTSQ